MPFRRRMIASLLVVLSVQHASAPAEEKAEAKISFSKDIAPIFVENCIACHNTKKTEGKFDMSSFDGLMKGGRKGKALVPGEPFESLLLLMMYGDEDPSMPKDAELLNESVVLKVEHWIEQGAKFDGKKADVTLRDLVSAGVSRTIDTNYTVPTPTAALAISPDGKQIAVGAYYEITIWSTADGKLLRRIPTKSERICALDYSPDDSGKLLVHAGGIPGRMGEVVLWDSTNDKPVKQLVQIDDIVFAAAFSPDGKQVAAGGTDRLFRIWDTSTYRLLHQVENHADWILDLTFSRDGKRIITASRDKSAKVWDQTTKEPILTFPSHSDGVYGIGISPDGKIATSTGADKTLRFWNATGDGKQIRSVSAHGDTVYALKFTNSGKTIFTAGADNLLKAWNPKDGKAIRTYTGHKDWVYSIAVSRDEKTVASGAWNGEVRIWDAASGKTITSFTAVPSLALANAKQPAGSAQRGAAANK